jgi:glutaredoxin
MVKYTVWGRPNCVWCKEAKKLLEYYFIEYEYKELTPDNMGEFNYMTGFAKSVPQIIKHTPNDGDHEFKLIGGYEDLKNWLK